MTKKGADTPKAPSEPPTWIEALTNPRGVAMRSQGKIDQHSTSQKDLLTANQAALLQRETTPEIQTSQFGIKQTASRHQATIAEDKFKHGQELKWIQAILAIDAKDPDPLHDNRNEILAELSRTDPSQVKVPKSVHDDTKDQLAEKPKDVNGKFSDYVINNLQQSGKALIVELKNPQGQTAPLALAILKGENGIWLHDPKFGCSFLFKKDDFENLKKFLEQHIKENHKGFDSGYIVKVFNKETLEATKTIGDSRVDTLTTAQKLEQEQRLKQTQTSQLKSDKETKDKKPDPYKP